MKRFTDRVAVVTGAAGGIGRATALLLAEKGCSLAIADVNERGLAETAELIEKLGRKVSTHKVDVSDKARMQEFVGEVLEAHGRVNIVINNAGVAVLSSFQDHKLEDFEWLMGVNFWGVVYGCKFFLPALLEADEAHIVNLSSLFGLTGVPLQTSYCASKFAVRGFTESLRMELHDTNVGVTNIHPGGIATDIVASSRVNGGADMEKRKQSTARAFTKMMPPSEAAALIVRGIERNSPRVLITRETYVADGFKRLLPAASVDLIAWGYSRMNERQAKRQAARAAR
ncbi:MAG TPA: SDR family oxidoreductase [Polyangiales bacterium]|nr:SDR family oxidoreductase [Polyangiales bacterium]